MPVDNKHEQYENRYKDWTLLRDVVAGERVIKDGSTEYLPMLSGQNAKEYSAYKTRGSFFGATCRTVQGLTGAIMRRAPTIALPAALESMRDNITLEGVTLVELARSCCENVIHYGRYGLLIDMSDTATFEDMPYIAEYGAADILNWHIKVIAGKKTLTMVALAEIVNTVNPADRFEIESTQQMRVLELDEYGYLVVSIYQKESEKGEWLRAGNDICPVVKGKRLDYIPFVFMGAMGNTFAVQKPPLLDLANLNIKHWQVSVDYYHGLHWCALPTPWAAGFPVDAKLYIGCSKAWVAQDPNAKAGFLEFTGQGLGAVEKALNKLEYRMAVMGARFLEEGTRRVAEAADTLRMRARGETATLSNIAGSVEKALERALGLMALWISISPEDIDIELNKDFVSTRLSAQDIAALLQAYLNGAVSLDSFIYNLHQGEVLPEDRTVEDEKLLIATEESDKEFTGGMAE